MDAGLGSARETACEPASPDDDPQVGARYTEATP